MPTDQNAMIEEMLMIEPPSVIAPAAAWAIRKLPRTLTRRISSKLSGVSFDAAIARPIPALLTRMSTRPSSATVSATRRVQSAGTPMSAAFLARMAQEIEHLSYFKIETAGAASKLRELIRLGGDAIIGPWDGEEAITLMADLDAGATGAMTGGAYPDGIRQIIDPYFAGDKEKAAAAYEQALTRLKPGEREAVIGRVELGLSYDELALALEKPTADATRKAAQRALVRLAEEMERDR